MKHVAMIMAGVLLAACADPGDNGQASITVTNGGGLGGTLTTTIFADDRVRVVTTGPFSEDNVPRVSVVPGAYGRALTEVRRLLPAAIEGAATETCPDYGTDTVAVSPAIDGAAGVSVGCPDDDVSVLIRAVNAATAPAEPL